MKATVHPDFLIRNIAGESILIGCGEQVDFTKMLMLNETSEFLIRQMQNQPSTVEELAQYLVDNYDVSYSEALNDTAQFIHQLEELGCVTWIA